VTIGYTIESQSSNIENLIEAAGSGSVLRASNVQSGFGFLYSDFGAMVCRGEHSDEYVY
jgi:hypothetical protein